MKFLKILLPIGFTSLLAACGGSSSSNSPVQLSPSAQELQGSWELGCSIFDYSESIKQTSIYNNNNINVSANYYEDTSCSMSKFSLEYTGTFETHGDKILNSGETVTKIQYMLESLELILHTDEFVATYNNQKVCGKANWKVNTTVDIRNCDAFSDIVSQLDGHKDIYAINGNNIYFGNAEYTSGEGYPTQIDPEFMTKN